MKQIDLTNLEQAVVQSALNAYFNDANTQLNSNFKLGNIEKQILEMRKKLTLQILARFEKLC